MLKTCVCKALILVPLILVAGIISMKPATAAEESGTRIPAESRPCVDCHAFEFMQRALQDLKKTAYNLDSRAPMIREAKLLHNLQGPSQTVLQLR
uniref:NELL2-interacting cell ontogeny regulator 1 n=1 Tax=Salvator merianae TaxID=96440 RepID=A0A8D0ED88_SALMN